MCVGIAETYAVLAVNKILLMMREADNDNGNLDMTFQTEVKSYSDDGGIEANV
jgi:hypothetical protein